MMIKLRRKIQIIAIVFFILGLFFGSRKVFAAELMTPYLQAVTQNSVYVMVEADNENPITVQYGETTGYGMTSQTSETAPIKIWSGGGTGSYIHKIKLTNLKTNTDYHYKTPVSSDYTFRTAPSEGTPFRFAWMSDIQGGSPAVSEQIAEKIKAFHPQFSLYGGDLANDAYHFKTDFFIPKQKLLLTEVPFFLTWGNHDVYTGTSGGGLEFLNVSSLTKAPDSLSNSQQYYSFDYGDLHVLVLNFMVDYSVGSAQYVFAQNDLATTNKKWKIVISHASAYVYKEGGGSDDPALRVMSTAIFEPNKVDLVISGHAHFYQRNYVNGVYHLIVASAGAGLYDPADPSDPRTQKSLKTYSFGIFDVNSSFLTMKAYKETGEEIDSLVLCPGQKPAKSLGNANCDDAVDGIDFEIWREEFNGLRTTETADFDNNGQVTPEDYSIWMTNRNR